MPRKWLFILSTALLVLVLSACNSAADVPLDAPGEEVSQVEPTTAGETAINASELYTRRCSGCHGADREGKNGPALLPDVLTKDPSAYVNIITNGSGPMPSWGSRLSADEINQLVEFILSGVE